MNEEHFLITGGMGCLGAWVIRNLVQEGIPTTIFDLSTDDHRLRLIMSDEEVESVNFIRGDITNTDAVKNAVIDSGATHLIHLAALQVPFCKANPPLGAAVNVVGTVNMFEAAKAAGIGQMIYASSVAVYGPREAYDERLLSHDAEKLPFSHYGVYKQANEGTARIYWQNDGIASIGLRPYTIYGPGRDQGLTSSPTKAMLAAAGGEGYHIPFGGYNGFQLANDIAKIFIQSARTPFEGANVFNIQGEVAHVSEVIEAIESAVPSLKGQVTFDNNPLPFPDGQADTELRALLGDVASTPLKEGVAVTIAHFKTALEQGLVSLEVNQ